MENIDLGNSYLLNVKGEISMVHSEDVTITIPKNTGKYYIDIHPIGE